MKAINWIKDNSVVLMVGFMIILFFRQCGVNGDVSKMRKEIKELTSEVEGSRKSLDSLSNSLILKEDVRLEMRKVMFEYLIFEDDLDKGKISLSDVKNKIETK